MKIIEFEIELKIKIFWNFIHKINLEIVFKKTLKKNYFCVQIQIFSG